MKCEMCNDVDRQAGHEVYLVSLSGEVHEIPAWSVSSAAELFCQTHDEGDWARFDETIKLKIIDPQGELHYQDVMCSMEVNYIPVATRQP